MHEGLSYLAEIPAPVIGNLQGAVAGAGFSFAYINVGTSSDVGGSWALPRIVGLRKAFEIALLSPTLDAAEARRFRPSLSII